MIKNFSLFKNNNKKKDNDPDYRISAKIGETFTDIGACWIKDGNKGKYVSCQLSKPYKEKIGFVVVEEEKLETPPEL